MSVQVTTDFRKLDELIRRTGKEEVRILHDGVEYGIYNEFGTTRVPAKPFIGPALERVRKPFRDGVGALRNIENLARFVDKIAHDAEVIAKSEARVDTSKMKNSIRVSRPGQVQI